ncbi:MAG: NAD(P)H-hydrate epimerase [Treponema sp.]|nr:NAD(P)H-hydrate epimerase [Treponema sp.]
MKAVFSDSQSVEKEAKARYAFPEFVMMENAAAAMEAEVLKAICRDESDSTHASAPCPRVLIICGSGNNGGDGYALARRLCGKIPCDIFAIKAPKTEEAIAQRKMAESTGVPIFTEIPADEKLSSYSVIVDCILGTGFSGELKEPLAGIIEKVNSLPAYKLACDIPTGLHFNADLTITMGCLKTALFSDPAKDLCGTIQVADLGITPAKFEACGRPDAFLIEKDDIKLPWRKNKASHKGSYGHTAVFAGEKSGAGILAASAALNFGSGLVTLVKTENSNLQQFKISPELMINDKIPANTTCVLIGSGLGGISTLTASPAREVPPAPAQKALDQVKAWFRSAKAPACLFDADLFSWKELPAFLDELGNSRPEGKIILTPHLKELKSFCDFAFPGEAPVTIAELTQAEKRIEIGKKICQRFPGITLIMKSANTFIAAREGGTASMKGTTVSTEEGTSNVQVCICDAGAPSLAKAGSGDVLAGMTAALLAQGYTARDAAITAVYAHALAGSSFANGEDWGLTAEKLITKLGK